MDASRRRSTAVLVTCAAAAAGATVWLLKQLTSPAQAHTATDFETFLVAPPPPAPPRQQQQRQPAVSATCFESFLKVAPAAAAPPCSTDFDSFLIDGGSAAAAVDPAAADQALEPQEAVPEDAVPVAVLYGTEYGFAREIGEKLAAQLKETGRFWPLLDNAAHHPDGYDFSRLQVALLVCSTQGDGVPPTEARGFCDWLTSGGAGDLSHLAYSVCALGDTSYTHYCRCGRSLDAALATAGAAPLVSRVDVDKEDWPRVDAWLGSVVAGLQARSDLATFADLGGVAASGLVSSAAASGAAPAGYSRSRPYYATVASVDGLCVLSGPQDKDTVKLELTLDSEALAAGGLAYSPGDALGIWPTNPPQAVDDLLSVLGATGEEAVAVPSWHYQEQGQQQQPGGTTSLRHALSVCYDVKTPKAKQLLTLLQQQLAAAAGAAKPAAVRGSIELQVDATAAHLVNGDAGAAAGSATGKQAAGSAAASAAAAVEGLLAAEPAALEAYLSARHVADILQEFAAGGAGQLSAAVLLPVLRPLQPRLYSISSSPLEYATPNTGVAATIAVVRYTSLGKERQGVTSTQVAERLSPGQRLPVFISKNPDFRLPPSRATPAIMVGPGTGLAPFRSFILQRLLEQQGQQEACGAMHLFFGCRRRDQDFLYGPTLTAWHDDGAVTLHTAFSREGPNKVYVQQRLREAGDEVWRLLEAGAHFYVCGDAGSMAGAVEVALLDIIAAHLGDQDQQRGGDAKAAAAAYLERLAASGRYQRDVWFS